MRFLQHDSLFQMKFWGTNIMVTQVFDNPWALFQILTELLNKYFELLWVAYFWQKKHHDALCHKLFARSDICWLNCAIVITIHFFFSSDAFVYGGEDKMQISAEIINQGREG